MGRSCGVLSSMEERGEKENIKVLDHSHFQRIVRSFFFIANSDDMGGIIGGRKENQYYGRPQWEDLSCN